MLVATAWVYGLRMTLGDLVRCAVMGVATFTLCPVLMYAGVGMSRAADAAILTSAEPLLVSLGAYLYLRERVAPRTFVALIIAMGGATLLSEFWKEAGSINPAGTLLIVGGVFFEAWYSVLGKELLARHAPLKVATVALVFACVVNGLVLTGLGFWGHAGGLTLWDWFLLVFFLAGLCTLVGYTVWYVALRADLASRVAITIFTQPVFGIAIAWLWVNETPTASQLTGTAVILAAVAFALFPSARQTATEKAPPRVVPG